MPTMETGKHKLPYLAVSQAQKEITHNEALALIDALVHPVAEEQLSVPPAPTDADIGKCWLVGSSPVAEWTGRSSHVAIWAGGGWRYFAPSEGMRLRLLNNGADLIWSGNTWIAPPQIADPANGAVVDVEARQAIVTLLSYFRTIGQIIL